MHFKLNPTLRDVFRRGIVKAAQASNAIIMTGGTNSGVMMHVGKAIREHSSVGKNNKGIPCIGFSSHQVITHSDQMRDHFTTHKKKTFEYNMDEKNEGRKFNLYLDPNHTECSRMEILESC